MKFYIETKNNDADWEKIYSGQSYNEEDKSYTINIPLDEAKLVNDVKITFALIFLSYIVTLLTMVFTTSTFVTNRTDIQGTRNILNNVLRFVSILLIFNFVSVKLYWVAAATLIPNVVVVLLHMNIN